MKNIYVYCEGSTEESFVNNILNPYLAPSEIFVYPIVCRTSQKRGIKYTGGVSRYGKIRFELSQLCKEHHNEIVTTMLDYYGLPQDTPGYHTEEGDLYQKIEKIETAVCQDIGLPNLHFNLTVHEFEGLLFSQPSAFISIVDAATVEEINKIKGDFLSPEHINNSTETAPSKRLQKLIPGYSKVRHGTLLADAIGIDQIRKECHHFDEWLKRIVS